MVKSNHLQGMDNNILEIKYKNIHSNKTLLKY